MIRLLVFTPLFAFVLVTLQSAMPPWSRKVPAKVLARETRRVANERPQATVARLPSRR